MKEFFDPRYPECKVYTTPVASITGGVSAEFPDVPNYLSFIDVTHRQDPIPSGKKVIAEAEGRFVVRTLDRRADGEWLLPRPEDAHLSPVPVGGNVRLVGLITGSYAPV